MVSSIIFNSSILHQWSKRRVPKPIWLKPGPNQRLIGEGSDIMLHTDEEDAYIVYTTDGSIPTYTNGIRYEPDRFPIIVPKDILSFTIKFIACKAKMVDSLIWVRNFNVGKNVPDAGKIMNPVFNQSVAVRAEPEYIPSKELNLGLDTPSSSQPTPQHPGRMSSSHNPLSRPIHRVKDDIDNLNSSDDSDEI